MLDGRKRVEFVDVGEWATCQDYGLVLEESEVVRWELNTARVREGGEKERYWNTKGEDVGGWIRKAELVQTSGANVGRERRVPSRETEILTLRFSCRESGQNTYTTQTCQNDGETKPQAREGEELRRAALRQYKGLCCR